MKFSNTQIFMAFALVAAVSASPVANQPFTCPEDCSVYYDGCNSCTCGGPIPSCTQMACAKPGEAYCVQKTEAQDQMVQDQADWTGEGDISVEDALAAVENEEEFDDVEYEEMLYAMPDAEESEVFEI